MNKKLLFAFSVGIISLVGCNPQKKDCKVTFDLGGGTGEFPTITVKEGNKISKPETIPTKEGYTFNNWYDAESEGNVFDFEKTVINKDTTIYAHWDIKKFTVIFDLDGGTIGGETKIEQTVDYEGTATQPADPDKTGYSFKYWSDERGLKFDFNTKITKPTTIYAKYDINKYTVTFDLNPEKIQGLITEPSSIGSQTVEFGNKITKPTDPKARIDIDSNTSYEYQFGGWYTDKEFTHVYNFNNTVKKDFTLYAKWVADKYVVAYDYGEGDWRYEFVEKETGARAREPDKPIVEGKTFKYWHKDGEDTPYDFTTELTDHLILVAKYEINKYNVSFNLNPGKIDDLIVNPTKIDTQVVEYNNLATKPADPTAKKKIDEGTEYTFQFGGWYTDTACTKPFTFNTPIKSNITLNAKWIADQYVVAFDYGDDYWEYQFIEKKEGAVAKQPQDRIKEGYTFEGWFIDKEFKQLYDFNTPLTDHLTLHAKYTRICYNIPFYDFNDNVISKSVVHYGDKMNRPSKDPTTKQGDPKFLDWYANKERTILFDFNTVIKSDDIKVYGGYTYTLTFNNEGPEEFPTQEVISPQHLPTNPGYPTPEVGKVCYGWLDENDEIFDFSKPLTKDTVLHPGFTDFSLTIEGVPNNMELGTSYTIKATKGSYDLTDFVNIDLIPNQGYTNFIQYDKSTHTIKGVGNGGVGKIVVSCEYDGNTYSGSLDIEVATYSKLKVENLKNGVASAKDGNISGTVIIPTTYTYDEGNGTKTVDITSIKDSGFASCDGITKVVVGEKITKIGQEAFRCFSHGYPDYSPTGKINEFIFNGVPTIEEIGSDCFDGQTNLHSIIIPKSVTTIKPGAFWSALTSCTFEDAESPWTLTQSSLFGKDVVTWSPKDKTTSQIAEQLKYTSEEKTGCYSEYEWVKNPINR